MDCYRCLIQWGKILGDTVNLKIINFPVSFNECFGGLALFNGDPVAAAEYATITDITNTNFKIYMYANNAGTGYANANIFYLFLGAQQQWGLGNPSINFPIAFPKECFIAAITRAAGNYEHSIVITTKNKTNLSWICKGYDNSAGNTYANWLALGCQLQWGKYTNSGNDRVITYPIAFSELYYANVISPDNCETFVYGISNTNINYRLCNGYNDDRWNGTQTSRLFAVGR